MASFDLCSDDEFELGGTYLLGDTDDNLDKANEGFRARWHAKVHPRAQTWHTKRHFVRVSVGENISL